MRCRTALWTASVLLLLAGSVRADDRDKALAVLDRSIRLHGGEKALTRAQNVIRTSSVAINAGGSPVAYTDEVTYSLPAKMKAVVKLDKGGQLIFVVNGDKAWQSVGGSTMEVGKERLEELREEMYAEYLMTLLPAKKEGVELAPLNDTTVAGRKAVGVKVSTKGHKDVRLYFDKESGMLVKVERQASEGGVTFNKEYHLGEHKEFDGVRLPTTRTESNNGKKFVEIKSLKYRFPSKIDDATFAKP